MFEDIASMCHLTSPESGFDDYNDICRACESLIAPTKAFSVPETIQDAIPPTAKSRKWKPDGICWKSEEVCRRIRHVAMIWHYGRVIALNEGEAENVI